MRSSRLWFICQPALSNRLGDHALAIVPVFVGQLDDLVHHAFFIEPVLGHLALRGSMVAQRKAGAVLRDARSCRTWSMHLWRREGLRRFPLLFRLGSAFPRSDPTPLVAVDGFISQDFSTWQAGIAVSRRKASVPEKICCVKPIRRTASAIDALCPCSTSNCRSIDTISSCFPRFLTIADPPICRIIYHSWWATFRGQL